MALETNAPVRGRRLRLLADSHHEALRYALRPASDAEFEAAFPGAPRALLECIFDGYRQALHGARVNAEAEFESICDEFRLADHLADLERRCEEQGIRGGDDEPLASLKSPALASARRRVTSRLEAEVARRQRDLEAARAQRAAAEAALEGARARVQGRVEALRALAAPRPAIERPLQTWVERGEGA